MPAPAPAPAESAPLGAPRRSPTREVWDLAYPGILAGFAQLAYHWVNQAWVGRLPEGTVATAALSVANYTVWAFFAFTSLLSVGLTALVGRYVGAGRPGAAGYVAAQGLRWSAVLAVLIGAIGFFVAPLAFAATRVSDAASAAGTQYVRVFYAGCLAPLAMTACDAIWRGRGNTRVSLGTNSLGLVLNALLDPLLIFGWGPVPALGVTGAAVSTVIASACATAVSLRLLASSGHLSRARPPDDVMRLAPATPLAPGPWPALDLAVLRRLVRVGLPLTASGLFFVGIYLGLSRIVARAGGDAAQAGLGVGLRGEQVAWMLTGGFQIAASSLVARLLGAGRPDQASAAAWRANWLASAGCLLWSVVLAAAPHAIAGLFLPGDAEAAARGHAADYFRLVSLCLVLQCWEGVLDGAFAGAGMTIPPMIVTMVLTALRIPLGEWAAFGLGWGVPGIWGVIVLTAALRGIVTALWFARGTWRHRTV